MHHVYPNFKRVLLFLFAVLSLQLAKAQAPHIITFHPDTASQGDTVLIIGTHFDSVSSVSFGGIGAHSFTILSDSLIWAVVGTGARGYVQVSSRFGVDSLAGFVYVSFPSPHIASFIPDSARQGDTVLVLGTHFTAVTSVSFGGVLARTYHVLNDSALWAVVGTGASGSVKVTRGPLSSSLGGFVFIPAAPPPAPHITSFSSDSARHNDTVNIRGSHLNSVTAVRFGGVAAQSFDHVNDSVMLAIVGGGASGFVSVANSSGSDSLGGFIFISSDTTSPPPPDTTAPFQLISFSGVNASGSSLLTWVVRHDQSIFFYSVEHSVDTIPSDFSSIGGVGSDKQDSALYRFTDTIFHTGVNYYRLRIIDSIGNTSFSNVIAVDLGSAPAVLSLYPNPARGYITVKVPVTTSSSRFVLADASGHVMLTAPVRAGVQQVTLPVSRLNAGIYKLVWTNGQRSGSQTVLLIR